MQALLRELGLQLENLQSSAFIRRGDLRVNLLSSIARLGVQSGTIAEPLAFHYPAFQPDNSSVTWSQSLEDVVRADLVSRYSGRSYSGSTLVPTRQSFDLIHDSHVDVVTVVIKASPQEHGIKALGARLLGKESMTVVVSESGVLG
jgi:hypothetical protein